MYYRPIGNQYYRKSNFHKDGKVYHQKPSINRVDNGNQLWRDGKYVPLVKEDWEIVMLTVIEEVLPLG